MSTPFQIEEMHKLAERIVARCSIEGTRFGEGDIRRDVVIAITTGKLKGRRFQARIPISGQMYRDQHFREMVIDRCEGCWRASAVSSLVPVQWLIGPKGKLPA